MPILRAQVAFARRTGLPEDDVVNTFHFEANAGGVPEATEVTDMLYQLYQVDVPVAAGALTGFMNGQVLNESMRMTVYNLAQPEPRTPIREVLVTGLTMDEAGVAVPEEAAVTLTFEGVPESGVAQARKRGRIFLGPLADGALDLANYRTRVSGPLRAVACEAMERLRDASIANGTRWIVYSPTQAAAGLDATTPVDRGWVDDAFDTIRSRGPKPLTRTTWD